ncbi:MAG: polyprenyl synthetase family protein [Clostridiales bacterium]|jgi:heptaprenyl diphosphate synthase|nr:polyprenyl synthetase family protein [Clostridiales bacterium]
MTDTEDEVRLEIQEARREINLAVTKALIGAPKPVNEMTNHLAGTLGKGVRSLLLLYAAAGEDNLVPKDAVPLAAAIELFHMATLVHDDVIDDASVRRGMATVQNRFGKKHAVICGDYLLCLAASLIAPLQASYGKQEDYEEYKSLFPVFVSSIGRTCLGELRQLKNNRNTVLDVFEYLRIVSGKTAALFYVSALSGALCCRLSLKEAKRLARFGRYLGMVFQIVDDCKDFEMRENEAQKTVGKDIAEGVVTLPLIYAIKSSPELADLAKQAFLDTSYAEKLTKAVVFAGGTEKAHVLARRYAEKAERQLTGFPESKTRPLSMLLNKSLNSAGAF